MLRRAAIAVLLALFAQGVGATDYLSENWDSGTPPTNWPYLDTPKASACTQGTFNGWLNDLWQYCSEGWDWSGTYVASDRYHSGTRSFRHNNPGTQRESGDIQKDFGATPNGTTIYTSFWMWMGPGWTTFNTPTAREPYAHFMFWNSGLSMTGPRMNLLTRVPYTSPATCDFNDVSGRPYLFFNFQTDGHDWNVGSYPNGCYNLLDNLQAWHFYEFGLTPGSSTGRVRIWIDGVLYYDATDTWASGSLNFNRVILSDFFSDRDGTSFDALYYLDDLKISDVYTGFGGAAPTASFTCSPLSSIQAPGTTNCTDASTGTPTTWAWTSTRCGTSAVQNPTLTCTSGGASDVCLTASNAYGSHQLCRTNYLSIRYVKPSNFGAQ